MRKWSTSHHSGIHAHSQQIYCNPKIFVTQEKGNQFFICFSTQETKMQTNYMQTQRSHSQFSVLQQILLLVVVLLVATFFSKCVLFSAATQTLVTQENATTQKNLLSPKRKLYRPNATQLFFWSELQKNLMQTNLLVAQGSKVHHFCNRLLLHRFKSKFSD